MMTVENASSNTPTGPKRMCGRAHTCSTKTKRGGGERVLGNNVRSSGCKRKVAHAAKRRARSARTRKENKKSHNQIPHHQNQKHTLHVTRRTGMTSHMERRKGPRATLSTNHQAKRARAR